MNLICLWNAKKKQKERKTLVNEDQTVSVSWGRTNIAQVSEVHIHLNGNKTSDGNLENSAGVSIVDIIALNREFRKVLEEHTDFTSKKCFVTAMKSVASEMMLQKFKVKNVNPVVESVAFVQRLLKAPLPVRTRLALAIHRFCIVVEEEMDNQELMQGTGFLESLCGGTKQGTLQATIDGHVHNLNTIPPAANFDLLKIYSQLINTDELPSLEEMGELLRRTSKLLKEEANIVVVSLPCVVVGDIHGQKGDLVRSIMAAGGPLNVNGEDARSPAEDDMEVVGRRNYLFLGDYVDRGPQSLQCVALLFAAKLLAPQSVFLLRGNHESSETNGRYGFLQECRELYPIFSGDNGKNGAESEDNVWELKEHPLWSLANDAFRNLPICAIVTNTNEEASVSEEKITNPVKRRIAICAMHGGLSPFISDSLDGIAAIDRFRVIEYGPLADITWADPVVTGSSEKSENANKATVAQQGQWLARHCVAFNYDEPVPAASVSVGYIHSARGRGHNFGEDVTLRFLRENALNFIVRAHQCVQEGFEWQHHKRLLTVFSAPNYCGLGNKGAILILHASGEPELVQFGATNDAESADVPVLPVPPRGF